MNADVNAKDSRGQQPLPFACRNGHTETVKLLNECGADVMSRDLQNNISWLSAAQSGNLQTAEILKAASPTICHIAKSAFVNALNIDGQRPLHVAVKSDDVRRTKLLIRSGADVSAVDFE